MDLGLKDRVAIVGGASRGLGLAIASILARAGASVTISARTEADLRHAEIELARLGSQQHVLAIPADLSVARDIRRVVRDTFNRFGQIGILVTHVADGPTGQAADFDDETIMTSLETAFLNSTRIVREVIPYMKQQRWGRIIHLLPHWGSRAGGGAHASSAGQLALVGHAKTLSNQLASFNITVNNVIAGPIQTDYLTSVLEDRAREMGKEVAELVDETTSAIPMLRLGKPEEVADLVAFMASPRAGYLTGANVFIDGGAHQEITW